MKQSVRVGILLPCIGLALLIAVAYQQVFSWQLTGYDEYSLITHRLSWLQLPTAYTEAFKQDALMDGSVKWFYRPLLTWSFITDARLFGSQPLGYHLTNLALHILACSLIYLFLLEAGLSTGWAFTGAGLFAVHPVVSSAVAWIPGRNDILLTIFFILSYLSFRRFLLKAQWRWLGAHGLTFLLALLTKETGVLLPLMCWLSMKQEKRAHAGLYSRIIPVWIAAMGIWLALRSLAGVTGGGLTGMRIMIDNLPGIFTYIGKIFWPYCLNGIPILPDSRLTLGIGVGITVIVGCLLIMSRGWKNNRVWFGLLWFLILLSPTLIPVAASDPYQKFMEHRIYLPLVGLILAGLTVAKTGRKWPWIGVIVGVGFVVLTIEQNQIYVNPSTFWEHTVACSPHSAVAWANLGTNYFLTQTNTDRGEAALKKALELYPGMAHIHGNLATYYVQKERYPEAETEMQQELNQSATTSNLFLMGVIEEKLGYLDDAASWWRRVLTLDPQDWRANMALVQYEYQEGNLSAALPYYEVAHAQQVQFDPDIEKAMGKIIKE